MSGLPLLRLEPGFNRKRGDEARLPARAMNMERTPIRPDTRRNREGLGGSLARISHQCTLGVGIRPGMGVLRVVEFV